MSTHTHTESFTGSQRSRCGIRDPVVHTAVVPRVSQREWLKDLESCARPETWRERQRQHILERRWLEALAHPRLATSHSQTDTKREVLRWPLSYRDAAPHAANMVALIAQREGHIRVLEGWQVPSDPSSRPDST